MGWAGRALTDPSPVTGIAAGALSPGPHSGPGGAAGSDGERPGVHLRLGDGVFPHHTLQPPPKVGLGGRCTARSADWQLPGGSPAVGTPAGPTAYPEHSAPPRPRYWPVLDNALRAAAFAKGVRVRLLVGCGLNTDPSMFPYLRSLQALSDPASSVSVDVVRASSRPGGAGGALLPPRLMRKVFIVPVGNHSGIPFSRVNHSKFMVTEKAAYIGPGTLPGSRPRAARVESRRDQRPLPRLREGLPGLPSRGSGGRGAGAPASPLSAGTSNWSEDYFSSTAGVGLVVAQSPGAQPARPAVQEQLRLLFERDWSSRYAVGLDGLAPGQDCVWRG
ncbi:5'-3' exonuclease pld4 [Saguinus oedipus]|uniref:5'-3' exonuclease pld4 n=1 Tax=Saguinus oedipus TaxID=9490 RepID=A0ABQ9V898_SAGOE|nr:5'-3' exonuclease pld4 [Saguinus oedipus]